MNRSTVNQKPIFNLRPLEKIRNPFLFYPSFPLKMLYSSIDRSPVPYKILLKVLVYKKFREFILFSILLIFNSTILYFNMFWMNYPLL